MLFVYFCTSHQSENKKLALSLSFIWQLKKNNKYILVLKKNQKKVFVGENEHWNVTMTINKSVILLLRTNNYFHISEWIWSAMTKNMLIFNIIKTIKKPNLINFFLLSELLLVFYSHLENMCITTLFHQELKFVQITQI